MDLSALQKVIGVQFRTEGVLIQALTRRSYSNENRDWAYGNNERLEFLGDAVLELIVTEFVMVDYGDKHEGHLTEIRSKLVCNETLWTIGERFNLYSFIFLSRGDRRDSSLKTRQYHTACAYEALIGAIYADFGYKAAQRFVHRTLLIYAEELCVEVRSPKTILNQMAQQKLGVTPTYEELDEDPTDSENRFLTGVFFDGTLIAQARGRSKKQASANAARAALSIKDWG